MRQIMIDRKHLSAYTWQGIIIIEDNIAYPNA